MTFVLTFAIGILVLGVLVFVHELGHFLAAKLFGVRVISFSIGFGKPLVHKRIGDTDYRISAIPFGGFVHMAGEHPDDVHEQKPDEFNAKPIWQRAIIALAGPSANYVAALLCLWVYLMAGDEIPKSYMNTVVGHVAAESDAYEAGIRAGDRVLTVNGSAVHTWLEVFDVVQRMDPSIALQVQRGDSVFAVTLPGLVRKGEGIAQDPTMGLSPFQAAVVGTLVDDMPGKEAGLQVGDSIATIDSVPVQGFMHLLHIVSSYDTASGGLTLGVVRDGRPFELRLEPAYSPTDERYMIGFSARRETVLNRVGPLEAIPLSFKRSGDMVLQIANTVRHLATRRLSTRELSGPVGIVQMSGGVVLMGLRRSLYFLAFIGVNLALLNLLPLIITDGGLLFFMALEAMRGKPLSLEAQLRINQIAIALFIALFVYVTFNDILRLPKLLNMTSGG